MSNSAKPPDVSTEEVDGAGVGTAAAANDAVLAGAGVCLASGVNPLIAAVFAAGVGFAVGLVVDVPLLFVMVGEVVFCVVVGCVCEAGLTFINANISSCEADGLRTFDAWPLVAGFRFDAGDIVIPAKAAASADTPLDGALDGDETPSVSQGIEPLVAVVVVDAAGCFGLATGCGGGTYACATGVGAVGCTKLCGANDEAPPVEEMELFVLPVAYPPAFAP